jgi:transcriptional regulator with XRE-family HTH domain
MNKKQSSEMAVRIKKQRKTLGFTQESFSELVGITVSSYSKIENAFQNPSLDTMIKIADKLNLSIDYIVYGYDREKQEVPDNIEDLTSLLDFVNSDKLKHAGEVISRISKIKKK